MNFNPTQAGGPIVELPMSASTNATVRPRLSASRAMATASVVFPVSIPPMRNAFDDIAARAIASEVDGVDIAAIVPSRHSLSPRP
jgi:hypothetical protein